jgi:hypothetical protein
MSLKNTPYYKKLERICEKGKAPMCKYCGKEINLCDAEEVEYVKPKGAPEFFVHSKCI